jgi:RNA polymerase sigma-70 factor (ECF subfamily)
VTIPFLHKPWSTGGHDILDTVENSQESQDLEAFVSLLTGCQADLLSFIRMLCGDSHLAADIRQAVNVTLWRKRDTFTPGTSFRNWAYRVADYEVRSHLRSLRRKRLIPLDDGLLDRFAAELPAAVDELPERLVALNRCLERLKARDLELIRHRYWSKDLLESHAESTNRSVGTLKARLFQLRSLLRECVRQRLLEAHE